MRRLVLAALAAALPIAPALAQQQDRYRHSDREQHRIADRSTGYPEGATKVGQPNPYATQGGKQNPYATRGGDPNSYSTRGGSPSRHSSRRGVDPNGSPPAPVNLKPGSSRR